MHPVDTFPWVVQSPAASTRATPHARRALRAVWTSTCSIHGLRFGPRHARRRPVARVYTLAQPFRGPASLAVGHVILGLFGAVAGPWQAERALCVWATLEFRPSGLLKLAKKIIFSFGFNLNLNFEKLYLNIQSSKNYETSSVGFVIF
jgi:hypothetical protein